MKKLQKTLGKADIYIIDQLMKGAFKKSDKILDAGCGSGRNLKFLYGLGFHIDACDINEHLLKKIAIEFPLIIVSSANLSHLPYANNNYDYIICNAVLHFAETEEHFKTMINELQRVLKPNGTLFIRMTSVFGIENLIKKKTHQYLLPDGTHRFLLTKDLVHFIESKFSFKEVLKTVNVNNLRCMSTLVLKKKA